MSAQDLILYQVNHLITCIIICWTHYLFLIGQKCTVNLWNQSLWRHLAGDYTIIMSKMLKVWKIMSFMTMVHDFCQQKNGKNRAWWAKKKLAMSARLPKQNFAKSKIGKKCLKPIKPIKHWSMQNERNKAEPADLTSIVWQLNLTIGFSC